HPVGAAKVDVRCAAVFEIENSAVLEKTSDDAAHANAMAQSVHVGPQRARSSHDEVDFHTRARCPVQRFDHRLVKQGMHLGDDPCWLPAPSMIGLAIDELDGAFSQVYRRDEQWVVVFLLRARSEKVEYRMHGRSDLRIGGQ